jgi:hypothetical protein
MAATAPPTGPIPPPTKEEAYQVFRDFCLKYLTAGESPIKADLAHLLRTMGAFRVGEVAAAMEDGVEHTGKIAPVAQTAVRVWARHIRRHYTWRGDRDRKFYPVAGQPDCQPELCGQCPLIPTTDFEKAVHAAAGKTV